MPISGGGSSTTLTQEQIEDYVGNLLADSDTIDVTYNDAGGIESFAPKFVGCKAVRSTSQNVSNATHTPVQFNAADAFDTDSLHDTVTNNTRITVDRTGKWRFTGNAASWETVATDLFAFFKVNGSGTLYGYSVVPGSTVNGVGQVTTDVLDLTSGDYVEFVLFQASGTTRTVSAATFSAQFLGA